MTIDLQQMRKRLEEKQAELQADLLYDKQHLFLAKGGAVQLHRQDREKRVV